MKKSNRLLSVIILATAIAMLFSTISCQKQDTEADIAAINKMYDQYLIYINTGDLDNLLSLWDDNAISMVPDNAPIIGKDNIRKSFEAQFEPFNLNSVIYGNIRIEVDSDMALGSSNYILELTPKEGGPTIRIDGKQVSIFKRQTDGSWKIYINISNNNAPPTVE